MKLSDYVVQFLYENGVRNCFLVSGGAVLHLVNSVNEHPGINVICSQHEQASASAADAVSRISDNQLGFCLATSGPGATNLLTGICNAYFDFIPLITITGQVSSFRKKRSNKLRQLGFQETEISDIYSHITKYAVYINDPLEIRYELEKSLFLATEGRPGPVVIDIPDDFQRIQIDPEKLRSFVPQTSLTKTKNENLQKEISFLFEKLQGSQKPLLLLGSGFHICKKSEFAIDLINKLNIPTLLTWGAKDLIPYDHELNLGGLGVCGSRLGNWAVQDSDFLIVIGSRLSQMITGSKLNTFAPQAMKIMIDIDREEFSKFQNTELKIDYFINADIRDVEKIFQLMGKPNLTKSAISWKARLSDLRNEYNVYNENSKSQTDVNIYQFMKILSDEVQSNDVIFTDAGGNLCWTLQAFENKKHQRLISAWNHSPMGYSLPASIGAAVAKSDTRIISIIGDGGIMMCLQEIATIVRNCLNIKIIIINNLGHGIQKQTIETWLQSKYVAVDYESGLQFPDFEIIAKAFGINYSRISSNDEISKVFGEKKFKSNSPQIIEVMVDPNERITPMLKFGSGLENLSPEIPVPII